MSAREIKILKNNYFYNFVFGVDHKSTPFFVFIFILFFQFSLILTLENFSEKKTYAEHKKEKFKKKRKEVIVKKIKNDLCKVSPLYNVLQDLVISYFGVDDYIKLNEDLLDAAKNGDLEFIKKAVEEGADVRTVDIRGRTALDFAISQYWELYGNGYNVKESDIDKLNDYRGIIKYLQAFDYKSK